MSFDIDAISGNEYIGKDTTGTSTSIINLNKNNEVAIELNEGIISYVDEFIEREADDLNDIREKRGKYLELYDKILSEYDLPVQLKYLSVIESDLKSHPVSPVGAVGPWQLMKETARDYGLTVNKKTDERTNYAKSTKAAAKILKGLYKTFGNWLLVIAAYNTGEGRVQQAIRKAKTDNYWDLQQYLPAQTRSHVRRYIATHFFFEGSGSITTMGTDEVKDYETRLAIAKAKVSLSETDIKNTSLVNITGQYKAAAIAENLQMNIANLNRLNPGLEYFLYKGSSYQLRLPNDKLSLFREKKKQILRESERVILAQPVVDDLAAL